jgi:SAM-dependent methyltransferase
MQESATGWDDYAQFYDWENARTLGRRDVPFWTRVVRRERGRVLELGCGTGRLLAPLARAGARIVGVDYSEAMLAQGRRRVASVPKPRRPARVRGDIRALPFPADHFRVVLAPYGMLQSLTSDPDLDAGIAEAVRVLQPGGLFGVDLVPDLVSWDEYRSQVRLRGRTRRGESIVLVESVRQDRKRGLTIFDESFVRVTGRRRVPHRFSLTFRTLPIDAVIARLERAGLEIDAVLGDYAGGPWDPRADVWIVIARKPGTRGSKPPRPRRPAP